MDEDLQFPGAEETVLELKELLEIIETAVRFGCLKTQEFFHRENRGKPIDRALAPNLVRHFAKRSLLEARQQVIEDEDQFDPQWIANNGLYVVYGRYHIRILKADSGDIPPPGQSAARQSFYQQAALRFQAEDGQDQSQEPINLVLIWDVVAPYTLSALILACPLDGKTTRQSVELVWKVNIPLRVVAALPQQENAPSDADDLDLRRIDVEEEDEDLPLKLAKDASEETDD